MVSSEKPVLIGDLLSVARKHWFKLALVPLAFVLAGVAYALSLDPVYRAEAQVLPASDDPASSMFSRIAGQLGPLSGLVGGLGIGSGGARTDLHLATLRSRSVLEQLIEKHGLLPVLFPERWDPAKKAWISDPDNPEPPSLSDGAEVFARRHLQIVEDRKSPKVTVAVEWKKPQPAALWANDIVAITNRIVRDRVVTEARRDIAYLDAEVAKTNVVERQQVIYRLMETKTGEVMMALGRPDYAFHVIDPAVPPAVDRPVRPRKRLIVAFAAAVGMALGGVLLYLLYLVQRPAGDDTPTA